MIHYCHDDDYGFSIERFRVCLGILGFGRNIFRKYIDERILNLIKFIKKNFEFNSLKNNFTNKLYFLKNLKEYRKNIVINFSSTVNSIVNYYRSASCSKLYRTLLYEFYDTQN